MDNVLKVQTKFEKEKKIRLIFESEHDQFFLYFDGKILDFDYDTGDYKQHPLNVQVMSSIFEPCTCWYHVDGKWVKFQLANRLGK